MSESTTSQRSCLPENREGQIEEEKNSALQAIEHTFSVLNSWKGVLKWEMVHEFTEDLSEMYGNLMTGNQLSLQDIRRITINVSQMTSAITKRVDDAETRSKNKKIRDVMQDLSYLKYQLDCCGNDQIRRDRDQLVHNLSQMGELQGNMEIIARLIQESEAIIEKYTSQNPNPFPDIRKINSLLNRVKKVMQTNYSDLDKTSFEETEQQKSSQEYIDQHTSKRLNELWLSLKRCSNKSYEFKYVVKDLAMAYLKRACLCISEAEQLTGNDLLGIFVLALEKAEEFTKMTTHTDTPFTGLYINTEIICLRTKFHAGYLNEEQFYQEVERFFNFKNALGDEEARKKESSFTSTPDQTTEDSSLAHTTNSSPPRVLERAQRAYQQKEHIQHPPVETTEERIENSIQKRLAPLNKAIADAIRFYNLANQGQSKKKSRENRTHMASAIMAIQNQLDKSLDESFKTRHAERITSMMKTLPEEILEDYFVEYM